MSLPQASPSLPSRADAVRRVLWIVLALNLAVTLLKLIVGLTSGALSVVADAFHSTVDSSSNIIGLIGVWVGARPADDNHPYGHHKYETIAAMAIGVMLIVAGFEIGRSVVGRLLSGSPATEVTALTIGLMALTFVVNVAVTVYEARAGRQLQSAVLLADAAHTRADLFVTLSVIASLIGGELGWTWFDPLVAGGVVLLLFRAAFGILRSTSDVLSDVAVANPEVVRRIASGVPGVRYVHEVRSRGQVDAIYVDLHAHVNPAMDTDQAHALASEVERRILAEMPGVVDAVVHIEPAHPDPPPPSWENLSLTLPGLADGMGIGLHNLHAHAEPDSSFSVELHLEVDASLTLGQAHALADEFERRARAALPPPGLHSIVTHLEPLPTVLPDEAGGVARLNQLRQHITRLANRVAGDGACHNVELHNVNGHLTATLHVTQPAGQPLVEAHALAETIESQLHAHEARLQRVVVHVEPPE